MENILITSKLITEQKCSIVKIINRYFVLFKIQNYYSSVTIISIDVMCFLYFMRSNTYLKISLTMFTTNILYFSDLSKIIDCPIIYLLVLVYYLKINSFNLFHKIILMKTCCSVQFDFLIHNLIFN